VCLERLKERLANLREIFRAVVLLMLAIMGGIVVNIYQVLSHKVPFYTIFLSVAGLIITARVGWYVTILIKKMQELEEEIKC
jgi:hypothetical protein